MKKIFFALFLSFFFSFLFSEEIVLKGVFKQGGFITANLPRDIVKVYFNDKDVNITNHFIFVGFSRDQENVNDIIFVDENDKKINWNISVEKINYNIQRINKIAKKYVEKPKNIKLEKRINKESANLYNVRHKIIYKNRHRFFKDFNIPLIGRISGVFGSQRVINGKKMHYHNGVDIVGHKGTPINGCASGIVVLTGDYFYNGKFVLIDHGMGVSSIYIHLSKIDVLCGQFVEKGEKIGEVGDTGRAKGAHLHWGVYWKNIPLNPLDIAKSMFDEQVVKY